jgi:murein tripeptide amidase MpaA
LPYAFDSYHFETGANRTGLDAHPMAPMQSTDKVALALVSLAERPRRELTVPRYALLGTALHTLIPAAVERAVLHLVREWHFGHTPQKRTHGNLFAPEDDGGGVHGHRSARTSLLTMLAWGAARLAKRLVTPVPKPSLRPHAP